MDIEIIIILNSRHSCTEKFLKRFQQKIDLVTPGVPEEGLFTAEELSGKDYWDPLSDYEKSVSGSCMDYLTRNGLVPFEYVPRPGRNPYPLQYRVLKNWNH